MLIKLNTCEPRHEKTNQCLYSLVCVGPEQNHIVGFLVSRIMFCF